MAEALPPITATGGLGTGVCVGPVVGARGILGLGAGVGDGAVAETPLPRTAMGGLGTGICVGRVVGAGGILGNVAGVGDGDREEIELGLQQGQEIDFHLRITREAGINI